MSNPIPKAWLTPSILKKRIICHWTVTSYVPDNVSLDSYHIVIDGEGGLHRGSRALNTPAPHTYGHNSAIGISLACMGGYQSPSKPGAYPPTKRQWEALIEAVRQLSEVYEIPVSRSTILMHGEVTDVLGPDQWGKWDIGWLPHLGLNGPTACGNELRRCVLEEHDDLIKVKVKVQVADKGELSGLLIDASTLVPVRDLCKKISGLSISSIDESGQTRTIKLAYETNGTKTLITKKMPIIEGKGYISISSLCESIGWSLEITEWTSESRRIRISTTH